MQATLQVVENCRARLPDQRKTNTEPERWFLKLKQFFFNPQFPKTVVFRYFKQCVLVTTVVSLWFR
jgi:hypothetical protein